MLGISAHVRGAVWELEKLAQWFCGCDWDQLTGNVLLQIYSFLKGALQNAPLPAFAARGEFGKEKRKKTFRKIF